MAPTIFTTGISGYIGGDAIAYLATKHPEYRIRALIRSPEQATALKSQFPNLELVQGSLDSLDLLVAEARTADIVLQAADADHRPGTLALLRGLAEGKEGGKPAGTYIHVSGAANLIDFSLTPGVATTTIVRDADDAGVITSLPRERIHAALEQEIISEGEKLGVRTAILSPAQVHGRGRGLKKVGYTFYFDAVLEYGKAFVVNQGENVQALTHVSDLSSAIELLIDAALSPSSTSVPAAGWGREGYYFVEAEELPFSYQAGVVARSFKEAGLIETSEIDHLTPEEVAPFHQYAVIVFGTSIKPRAQKLRALGWEPAGAKREETLQIEIKDFINARQ